MIKENIKIILEFSIILIFLAIVEIKAISLSSNINYLKNSIQKKRNQ